MGESFAACALQFLPTFITKSNVTGGSPRHVASSWCTSASMSCFAARSSASGAPSLCMRRSVNASLRTRRSSWAFIWLEFLVHAVSGMAYFGTMPHLRTTFIANE